MRYAKFGSTGTQVSVIGMGVMPLSARTDRPDLESAVGVIHHAVDCGVTLFDTADSYCIDDSEPGHNERVLGEALARLSPSVRQKLFVATKGGHIRPQGQWIRCGRPDHLRSVCEQSLVNLQVEQIDLYQYHAIDPDVPLVDSLGELKRMQQEGKIRHVGVSNFSVVDLDLAQSVVEVVSVQNQYSRIRRQPEQDGTLIATQVRGVAFIPWSPLNGMGGAKRLGDEHEVVRSIAEQRGVSPHQVVLAWFVSKGPMVFPIPGASRKQSIEDSARAADLELSEQELAALAS